MKERVFRRAARRPRFFIPIYSAFCCMFLLLQAAAQEDSLLYHGNLNDEGSPANGNFDILYRLFDNNTAGNQIGIDSTHTGVPVTDGAFSSEVKFGDGVFTGEEVWMELAVRPSGNNNVDYVPLAPRQKIHSLPAASFSKAAADVTGVLAKERLPGDTIYGVNGIVGPSMLPPDIVYTDIDGLIGPMFLPQNLIYGDEAGIVGPSMLPPDLIYGVNGIVGPSMLPQNLIYGDEAGIVGPMFLPQNIIYGDEAGIVGPAMLPPDLIYGVNGIVGPAMLPKNLIYGDEAGIVGPAMLPPDLLYLESNSGVSLLGTSSGLSSAVLRVESSSNNGVAMHVRHVSSNSTAVIVNEGTGDLVRGLSGKDGGSLVFQVENNGRVTAESFAPTSDRNAKENFAKLDPQEILQKLAAIPITRWNFKSDSETAHIGPMAQDFFATFGVGRDNKHIATVDADGIALAAIQGLDKKLSARELEIAELRAENKSMGARIDALEAMLESIAHDRESD